MKCCPTMVEMHEQAGAYLKRIWVSGRSEARRVDSNLPFLGSSGALERIEPNLSRPMSAHLPTEKWSPNWAELWRYGACWAGRPIGGVHLPGEARSEVMRQVMEQFMTAYEDLPGELQCRAFIQSHAVSLALELTRKRRLDTGNPGLWHDSDHRPTTPLVDLSGLQNLDEDGTAKGESWSFLHEQLKPRAVGLLGSEGVPAADAEDLYQESFAGLLQVRRNGTTVIHDLHVYEQLPPLFLTIVRRKLAKYIRHRHAAKRAVTVTESLDAVDDFNSVAVERRSFDVWAAGEADALSGLTFARLAEECAGVLSALQQRILTILYIEESANYMEVASSSWFGVAAGLKPGASEATCRRALDRVHDEALDALARGLGLNRATGGS